MRGLLWIASFLLACRAACAAGGPSYLVSGSGRAYELSEDFKISSEVRGCGNIHRAFRSGKWLYYSNGSLWRKAADSDKRVCVYRAQKGEGAMGFELLPDGGLLVSDNANDRVLEFDAPADDAELPLSAEKARVKFSVNAADRNGKLPTPHLHLRMVRKTPKGTYLICAGGAAVVREYDKTGRLLWEQETKPFAFEAMRLKNGNTLVARLDAIEEYTPDHRVVWRFTPADAPELSLKNLCGIFFDQRGRLVVGTYANGMRDGSRTTAFVLDREQKRVVWSYAAKNDRNMMTVLPL